MKHVIPFLRLRPDLMKAFSRGPVAGHKYKKRIPYFVNGKMKYRYYYDDDDARTAGKAAVDPEGAHEHYLMKELKEHYANLAGKLLSALDITVPVLKNELKIQETDVRIGKNFHAKYVAPAIEKERATGVIERSPLQRMHKAFEMIPDYLREMVDPETINSFEHATDGRFSSYKGLKEFQVNTADEDGYFNAGMCYGWASPRGELHIIDSTFKEPIGSPKFNTPLTSAEKTVWHEFGHHVHFAMEARPKDHPERKALEAWKKGLPGNRISDYAHSAWWEDFAETFACAFAFPKELAKKCPERYEFMREHVITSLPPIGDMQDTPDEDLTWWESKSDTPASKMLRHLQHRRPAPQFHTYYSDKDQFYTVQKDGRTLYLRIGPVSKDEEDGWERMPETTYTETLPGPDGKPITVTLPKHERLLGPRFKKTESIKEIYDENGKPLSDKAAYFYLGQDDPKAIEAAGSGERDAMDEYLKGVDEKKDDTHILSYKMYTALGFQLEHDQEKVRLAKVVAAQKVWDAAKAKELKDPSKLDAKEKKLLMRERPDFGLERHEWVPVEIDKNAFVQKTSTFKFGDVRPAAEQPWVARDSETGKTITRYDEATGKQTPVLTARVYEQENPDGTFTRLLVNESAPFVAGQTIAVPSSSGGYSTVKLKRGMSLDPYQLARDFGVSAHDLLVANGAYDRGQLADPILAALINPHGKPILDSTTLQQMMRDAALDKHVDPVTKEVVGRRAWVCLRGGTRGNDGIGHIQVEFDGAGPPKVVGDYWARRLGKSSVRIDEVLNAQDEIDIPKIKESKPKKLGTGPGSTVWFIDPKSEKRILGTVIEKKDGFFRVQPSTGQGVGISKTPVSVKRVTGVSEDFVAGKPGLRRRHIERLEKDILLYMDEVPEGSGDQSPDGVLRILLPKDGYDLDEVRGWPGVRVLDPLPGTMFAQLTISPEDIPRFRDAVGGFVMDSRVKAKLEQLDKSSRRTAEEHGKKQVVEVWDLEDEDGNIQPDGPLRELVLGDEGIQPGEHRIRALQKLAKNGGRLYAAHFMGCLSGDTLIPINRCGKGYSLTIRDLAKKTAESVPGGKAGRLWDSDKPTRCTSLVNGEVLRLNELLAALPSGVKTTFLVRTTTGREIRATEEHPFFTSAGATRLKNLRPGDVVLVQPEMRRTGGRKPRAYQAAEGLRFHPFATCGARYRVLLHRLVVEAAMNKLSLDRFIERCREGVVGDLDFLPAEAGVHHIDGDIRNNRLANLEVLSKSEHARKHSDDTVLNFPTMLPEEEEIEFIGDPREEETFDLVMREPSRNYVANGFVVSNTGKTALAIMAGAMMRNLESPESGQPHPQRSEKRTLHVVPLNTAENWRQEFVKFASPPTLIGASTLSGSVQIPKLPPRKEKESDEQYAMRCQQFWKDGLEKHPNWWNPWADSSRNTIVPYEYFRDNEEALRMLDQFDGLVVDEAHKIANENETSRAIERWNPKMKLFLLLSGTPITNTIDTLPRIVDLVTGGQTQLGTKEQFRELYLVASSVLKAMGRKNPPKTDINPQKIGELAAILQSIMDVATTADVKGKSMPAVLLDENEPAHMTGQQARMYRAAMALLTPEEREALSVSAALGVDEEALLNEESRRKIALARSIANCLGYKAPDQREEATYSTIEYSKDKKGNLVGRAVTKSFELPTHKKMTAKRPGGWGGKWPTFEDGEKGIVDRGYYQALSTYMDRILGVTYESIAGKAIDLELLKKVKSGKMLTESGEPWGPDGGKLRNPNYGPEGMICRGKLDEATGVIAPLKAQYFDSERGVWAEVDVPVGTRFVRDPRSKMLGAYYHENDWDFTGRFSDDGETGQDGGADDESDSDDAPKTGRGQQGPKEGLEGFTVTRHPSRRRERAQFDAVTTVGNTKCDKLEQVMRNVFKEKTGSGADSQMIIFGNRIGSSVRTAEAKLRTMGYMDINEALGNAAWSSDSDKERGKTTRKFFVSYMGKGATLGDRDINSEIFRRQQDAFGKDTGISMLVWRAMYGTTKQKYLKPGEMEEPFGSSHRKKIAANFADGTGKLNKNGQPVGLEMPMRVVGSTNPDGSIGQKYIYESEVPRKVRLQVKDLEILKRSQRGAEEAATTAKISALLMPFAVDRKPLTDAQIDIFNNTQVMVASDAANVGLNWPCEHLVMYDSLFSPMEEWQRITRAARMLPPAIRGPAKKLIEKVGGFIQDLEKENGFNEYAGIDSAMMIVRDAMEKLTPAERAELNDLPGGAPDQIMEAWFAQQAFDKIATLREEVGSELRTVGAVPDPTKPPSKDNFIPKQAIQESDIINEIIRKHLSPFEREIMKSRRYLVDVKRLTTSVDVPEFATVKVVDPMTGKKIKVTVPTGNFILEAPSQAERAQLAQGRAKMVPYEFLLKVIQSAMPTHTKYDFIDAYRGGLGSFSRLPEDDRPSDPQPGKAPPGAPTATPTPPPAPKPKVVPPKVVPPKADPPQPPKVDPPKPKPTKPKSTMRDLAAQIGSTLRWGEPSKHMTGWDGRPSYEGPGGGRGRVTHVSDTEIEIEPDDRERLDHYGNDGDGWDEYGWESDYSEPLRAAVLARLKASFDVPDDIAVDIGEKGHVHIYLRSDIKKSHGPRLIIPLMRSTR